MIGLYLILTHTYLFSMFGWSCRWKPSFQTRVALASLAESWLPCIPAFMCACGAWTFLNRTPWLSHLQQHATCHSKLKIMKMKPMGKKSRKWTSMRFQEHLHWQIGQSVLLRNNDAPVCTAENPCVVPSSGGEEGANLVVGSVNSALNRDMKWGALASWLIWHRTCGPAEVPFQQHSE